MIDITKIITRKEFEDTRNLDYDMFCKLVMKVVKAAVEETLSAIPTVMTHIAKQTEYIHELSKRFYTDNPDLANDKLFVAKMIEQAEAENPGEPYEQILEVAAKNARQRLGGVINKRLRDTNNTKPDRKQLDNALGEI